MDEHLPRRLYKIIQITVDFKKNMINPQILNLTFNQKKTIISTCIL